MLALFKKGSFVYHYLFFGLMHHYRGASPRIATKVAPSKDWSSFGSKIRNWSTLSSSPKPDFEFKVNLCWIPRYLECVGYQEIKFECNFQHIKILNFWTVCSNSQSSVTLRLCIVTKKSTFSRQINVFTKELISRKIFERDRVSLPAAQYQQLRFTRFTILFN